MKSLILGQNFWWAQKFCPLLLGVVGGKSEKHKKQDYGQNK